MSEDSGEAKAPQGMTKKVRRVKGGRRSKQSSSSSGSKLFKKGKDLLQGIQEEEEDSGHVNVAEQVRRLARDKEEEQPLDEVWGSKKRSTSWLWVSLFAVIVPLIGVGIGFSVLTKNMADEGSSGVDNIVFSSGSDDKLRSPHDWFDGESMIWLDKAVEIIRTINTAESPADFISSVRSSPYRELNPVDLAKWESPVVIRTLQDISWALPTVKAPGDIDASATGYLQINAFRANHDPVSVFFVERGGVLLVDWDATTIWSEMRVGELLEEKPQGGALVRAKIAKKRIFDEVIGGTDYSGYLVTSADGSEFIFAFIPLDSEKRKLDDERLKTVLNYGRFVGALLSDRPVTLMVRYGDGQGGGKRFEIVDFVHDKWVRPQ